MKIRGIDLLLLAGLMMCASALRAEQTAPARAEQIVVAAGHTRLLDMPVNIERVSIATPETAEAVPVSARTLMLNGKTPGETSLVIWLSDGSRREYDLEVRLNVARIEAAKDQLKREFGDSVQLTMDNGSVYLTGRVRDLFEADRAAAVATTLGRVVNLLKVDIPAQERQILLKVRFADVDRSKAMNVGLTFTGGTTPVPGNTNATFSLTDSLNLLLVDPHLNVSATLNALANQSVLQILAEPNVLAMNGKEASFVAGGEFPFPTLQGGGGGVGQVTIEFREFGIRIHFLPTITPRGTIRLHVTPEVSSLDYANSLSVQGVVIPALNTRRVETEVELQSGQSFAIAGLLDNTTTESLSRIPGLSDIPLLGKLFTTRSMSKQNSELLVIVTPELVEPIPEGASLPDLPRPVPFLEGPCILNTPPRTPGTDQTGPGPARAVRTEISVQEMQQLQRGGAQPQTSPTQAPGSATPFFNPAFTQPQPAPGSSPGTGGAATGGSK